MLRVELAPAHDSRQGRIITATIIILVRHAAHVDLDRRYSGRLPGIALSDAGRAQATRLGAVLARRPPDLIQCSPLDRTRATAEAIAAATGAPVEEADALIELDLGDWTGRDFASLHGDADWQRWNEERDTARVPGGETMAEAQARIVAHLAATAAAHDGRTVVMVTHADMIRAAVAHVIGLPLARLLSFDIDPASRSRAVIGDWGGRLLSLNEGID